MNASRRPLSAWPPDLLLTFTEAVAENMTSGRLPGGIAELRARGVVVVGDNFSRAQEALGVPLALANIAAVFDWPEDEFDEPDHLTEIARRTGAMVVLDVADLYSSAIAQGGDPMSQLPRFPLSDIAYVHTAGHHARAGR